MACSSSLSDQEWKLIEPLRRKEADLVRHCGANVRFKGGIFYQLKTAAMGDLPRDPPYDSGVLVLQTVARKWSPRRDYGQAPRQSARTSPKKPKWTTLIMIDSQAVKNTCNASIASKGFVITKQRMGSNGI